MNPILARHHKIFAQRVEERQDISVSHPSLPTKPHARLQETFSPLGRNVLGVSMYLKILYCPVCLYGRSVDMVRDVSGIGDGVTTAKSLGVINKTRQWSGSCNPLKEKNREVQK